MRLRLLNDWRRHKKMLDRRGDHVRQYKLQELTLSQNVLNCLCSRVSKHFFCRIERYVHLELIIFGFPPGKTSSTAYTYSLLHRSKIRKPAEWQKHFPVPTNQLAVATGNSSWHGDNEEATEEGRILSPNANKSWGPLEGGGGRSTYTPNGGPNTAAILGIGQTQAVVSPLLFLNISERNEKNFPLFFWLRALTLSVSWGRAPFLSAESWRCFLSPLFLATMRRN